MWSSKITFHSACPTDTFVMEPSYGHLDAHITHVTKSDVLIAVSFLAREERDYTAQYTISGVLGEDPLTITVMGTGSFDEKHEDMLNLVIDPLTSDSLNHV
ncbi:DLEC1 [Bugula neritina]|uniref:DLEC1 n=1 Tax=Bugula neritina TaxID=10212 RepID=A0A7J7K3D3_BUGNE|nr:DLEC1 [Bugula neritina]